MRLQTRILRFGSLPILLASLVFSTDPLSASEPTVRHQARLVTPALEVVIADNEGFAPAHNAGYSGVADLRWPGPGSSNVFVPFYAGLNFEHIFSGDAASYGWHIFEPRRAPMRLKQTGPHRIELLQDRTEHWPLRSRMVYEVKGDAIDLTFHGTPLADAWQKHGCIGIFFASYLHAPADLAVNFIGRSRPGLGEQKPRWIRHLPERHGVAANHRPAGSTWDPSFDPGFNIGLASGHSPFEFVYPFYYGRSGENALVFMFERRDGRGEMRFAQSPNGGGAGNPAWDFVYLRRDYRVGREFTFRVRTVFRKFSGAEDVIKLYEKWSGQKVTRPD